MAKDSANSINTEGVSTQFAKKLRALIRQTGITDSALARTVGVDPGSITRWTRDKHELKPNESLRRPTIHQLLLLSKYFNVAMEYFVDDALSSPISSPSATDTRRLRRDEEMALAMIDQLGGTVVFARILVAGQKALAEELPLLLKPMKPAEDLEALKPKQTEQSYQALSSFDTPDKMKQLEGLLADIHARQPPPQPPTSDNTTQPRRGKPASE